MTDRPTSNLRPAPAELTGDRVKRLLGLFDRPRGTDPRKDGR
ncbi:hypothetical protein [Sphingomonas paucimobilis]|nr:hypothetical protein [Sphingomonas paucimobilis]